MVSSLSGNSLLFSPSTGLTQTATTSASNTGNPSTAVASPSIYNPGLPQGSIMQLIGKMLEMMMMLLRQKMGSSADAGGTSTTYNTTPGSTSDASKYDPDAAGYASTAASKTNVSAYGYGLGSSNVPKAVTTAAPVLSAPKTVIATPAPAPVVATTATAAPKTQSNEELAKILGRA